MARRFHVATRKGLFTYERTAPTANWQITAVDFLGEPVTSVLLDPRDGTLYAALNLGHFGVKIHRRPPGENWEEIAVPRYPKQEESDSTPLPDFDPNDPMAAQAAKMWSTPPSLHQVWAMETGGADQPGLLWAGTIPGGLFVSKDRGDSWELIRSLWDRPERFQWFGGGYDYPGIHSICVDPRNSHHLAVAISCGGVWHSHDSGQTWECRTQGMYAEFMPPERREDPNIQDPHRMVRCAASPDHLWVAHHNGVFYSKNGGNNWDEITAIAPSKFGFVVAVHPREPKTAWFVPAIKDERRIPVDGKVVVARTRDGGAHFDVLANGLPADHAYDLVYRHALDVSADGNSLVFGSTTGSLWATDDQGDHWRTLSNHLPPIYQVRFEHPPQNG